jgi:hypothetical protein
MVMRRQTLWTIEGGSTRAGQSSEARQSFFFLSLASLDPFLVRDCSLGAKVDGENKSQRGIPQRVEMREKFLQILKEVGRFGQEPCCESTPRPSHASRDEKEKLPSWPATN